MKSKTFVTLILFVLLLLLIGCRPVSGVEPTTMPAPAQTDAGMETGTISAAQCPEPAPGAYLLVNAAQGICFHYPANYGVFMPKDGGLTLYAYSLLNTQAPLAVVTFEAANGRSLDEVTAQRLSMFAFSATQPQPFTLGGESAVVLDNLPGQDINRRVVAIHNDIVYDLMVARIGADYGEVGEQAEALYAMLTGSFQFIDIEPGAQLFAGPECPEPTEAATLFTNVEDGFCLLLPDGYAVDDSLVTDNGGTKTAVYVNSLMDVAHPRLFITVEDATGLSLNDITTAKLAEYEAAGFNVTWSFGYMLDGVPANQFDQIPGQDLGRQVVMVHNGHLYTLTFIPDDPTAEAYTDMQILYDTVLDSFSFLWQS